MQNLMFFIVIAVFFWLFIYFNFVFLFSFWYILLCLVVLPARNNGTRNELEVIKPIYV